MVAPIQGSGGTDTETFGYATGSDITNGTTRFFSPLGTGGEASEDGTKVQMTTDGILKNLRYTGNNSLTGAGDTIIDVRVNGSDTALDIAFASGVDEASDTSTEVSVSAGDEVSSKVVTGGTGGDLDWHGVTYEFKRRT